MDFYQWVTLGIAVSALGSLIRVFMGPTIWDRLLGFGLAASKVTLAVMMAAFTFEAAYILDLAFLFAMLGFLTTVLLARFIERRGMI